MSLPDFDVLVPRTLAEAEQMLADHGEEAALIAGGTDLLVKLRPGVIREQTAVVAGREPPAARNTSPPSVLVSLHRLDELRGIEEEGGRIRIGALTTLAGLASSPLVRSRLGALADGAELLGSPLVRNRGTYGGNICNARPAADTLVPTLALDGELVLSSRAGTRSIRAEDFVLGPGRTLARPDEILTGLRFVPAVDLCSAYLKMGTRRSLEISLVGVAAALRIDRQTGMVEHVRVALGAVGPTPLLAQGVSEVLRGELLCDESIARAARAARNDARPIDDHRGSAAFRLEMVQVLTQRALRLAADRGGKEVR